MSEKEANGVSLQGKLRKYVTQIQTLRGTIRQKTDINGSASAQSLQMMDGKSSLISQGIDGFQELCRWMRQGSDVCKDIGNIISERSALEVQYSKGLQKLSAKLSKTCANIADSTTCQAWQTAAQGMLDESEAHKKSSEHMMNDIYKPLKNLYENHNKVRKPIEAAVDKATRFLASRKMKEHKYKTKFFSDTADIEKLHIQIIERRTSGTKKSPDKELAKMEAKMNTLKEHVRTVGKQYYTCSLTSEKARQDWETTTAVSMQQFRQIEEDRLKDLTKYLKMYKYSLEHIPECITSLCNQLDEAAISIVYDTDLNRLNEIQTKSQAQTEQTLFECYAADMEKPMDTERRRQALTLYMYYLNQEIQSNIQTAEGLQKLITAYDEPTYADPETVQQTRMNYRQACAMLNFLDASHYKLAKVLHQINETESPEYQFSNRMETSKDSSGLPVTVLNLPAELVTDRRKIEAVHRRATIYNSADDLSDAPEYEAMEYNDFSDSDDELHSEPVADPGQVYYSPGAQETVICRCEVLYDYNASTEAEIHLKQGDIVSVYDTSGDWWRGELNGAVGQFPSNYVQELKD